MHEFNLSGLLQKIIGNEKKWIQVSLLAVPGQLSIERYSKTYSRGVLKIEPAALKNSIVYLSNDPAVNLIYKQVSKLISLNKKYNSMVIATNFLNEKLNASRAHSDSPFSAFLELQNRRLNK